MSQALILKAARIRLAEVWTYTAETWGSEQADRYLRELAEGIRKILEQRPRWRRLADNRLSGVFFLRIRHHFVFFRELEGQIAVISVLHEKMDLVARLHEDAEEKG